MKIRLRPRCAQGLLLQQRPEFEVVVLAKRLEEADLLGVVKDVVAMVVRSETKVTSKVIEAAPKLRVVGRAGVGTDNGDVPAATQRGVVVMNTPGGNTISTAELAFAMLLGFGPEKHWPASMTAGKWDRKQFQGRNFRKTPGFWAWAESAGCQARSGVWEGVVGYDPFLTELRGCSGIELAGT